MRKRIQQLAMGIFENSQPLLVFSEDIVLVETAEGTDAAGKFVITGVEQEPVRGVIVSSDPRMECLNPQFEGEQVQIRYLFHNYGFQEGNILKGEFTVISPSGEYSLPFVVSVTRQCPDSTVGKSGISMILLRLQRKTSGRPESCFTRKSSVISSLRQR